MMNDLFTVPELLQRGTLNQDRLEGPIHLQDYFLWHSKVVVTTYPCHYCIRTDQVHLLLDLCIFLAQTNHHLASLILLEIDKTSLSSIKNNCCARSLYHFHLNFLSHTIFLPFATTPLKVRRFFSINLIGLPDSDTFVRGAIKEYT